MKKLKLFSLALMALFATGVWAAPATSSDGKTVSGTVTFTEVTTALTQQTTYWLNGVKLYSYASGSQSSSNSLWTTSVDKGKYNANITAGTGWGSYTMSGLVMAQHAVAAHIKGAGTVTFVVNNNYKDQAKFDSNFKAYRVAANKYGDNYTTSTYKAAESGTEITSSLNFSCQSGTGRYTVTYEVTEEMLDANDEVIIKFCYGSSGTGAGKFFCYESITYTPACDPIGVASTGTATDVTYNSASLPFTMDKTTGVSSLTIEVFKNSDDSKVATYSDITPATSGSQAATGLSESTTYYYTITTVSAGGDYCEGETTAKSATFTTTAAPVANPEITGAVNEEGWGTVAPSSIIVTSGDELSIAGNVITCGGKTLTATAADATAEYTYAFDSWSGVTNGQSVTTNLTATANFSRTPNTYNITYTAPTNGNYTIKVGEESAVSENTSADYGQTVTLAATPNSGYIFSAWDVYKTSDESIKVTVTNNQFTMPAYAVTVSATFEVRLYTVTYNVNGGGSVTPSSEEQASAGASVTLPEPTWSGYTFEGWYNAGTKIGDAAATYTPTSDITLYAKWTDNTDGKLFSFVDGNYGDKFTAFDGSAFVSGNATGKDKTFTHATTGVQFIVNDGAWDKKNNAISALAKFKGTDSEMSVVIPTGKIATVKILYGAYGTGDDYKLTVNSTAQAAPATKFADDHTNVQILSDMREVTLESQTGTLTLGISNTSKNNYIGRVSAAITGYVITYAKGSAEGATGDSFTETKTAGSDLTLSDDDDVFTREGYILAGWSTNADGLTKTYDLGGSYTTDAVVTLYPYWEAIYGITIDDAIENGSVTAKVGGVVAATATIGQTVTLDVEPTSANYSISSVSVNGNTLTPEAGVYSFEMPAQNVTVSASFAEKDAAPIYWKLNAVVVDAAEVTYGSTPYALPTLDNPNSLKVALASSATDVAEFEGSTLNIKKAGTANISATYTATEDGDYKTTVVSYALTVKSGSGTSLDNTADEIKAVKFIENGQLFIRRGEKVYTITGELVK